MTHHNDDDILTTRETAQLLGVAVSTAQQWMENGSMPSWKTPGGHRRVRFGAVRRLMYGQGAGSGNTVQAAPLPRAASSDEFLPAVAPDYPVACDEAARLLAMDAAQLIDTAPESVFDRLTWLATQVTDSPMALVSLLTSRRQWFKSRIGVNVTETPRAWAFCSHAVLQDDLFIVENALLDPRFMHNPLVTGEPFLRFYAGFPLHDAAGHRLGTLCILDREPRKLREREVRSLRELSVIAAEEIQRRKVH